MNIPSLLDPESYDGTDVARSTLRRRNGLVEDAGEVRILMNDSIDPARVRPGPAHGYRRSRPRGPFIALLLLGLLPRIVGAGPAAAPPQEANTESWSVFQRETGPREIRFRGQPVARNPSFTAFEPGWKGSRFSLGRADPETAAADGAKAFVWTRHDPDGVETARMTLRIGAYEVLLTAEWTPADAASGPAEFSLQFLAEALRIDDSHAFARVDGVPLPIDLRGPFPRIRDMENVTFERPDRSLRVETFSNASRWQVQDRRAGGQGFFYVVVLDPVPRRSIPLSAGIRLSMIPVPPGERRAREIFLSQKPWSFEPVPIRNPGFEDGPSPWSPNPYAAIDSEIRLEGKHSARIEIDDPKAVRESGHAYLIQQLPIVPGSRYRLSAFVRTRDVRPAVIAGMGPTGATAILEWADPRGKWIAPGAYAPGVYGSRDWTRVDTGDVLAPNNAARAILFLALRARGTAWFDSVSLERCRRNIFLLEPIPESSLADNTPRFAWDYDPGAPCDVELSPDPSFAPDTVIRLPGRVGEATPDRPIPPGDWFWRVRCPAHDVASAAWRFRQTADIAADGSPPRIAIESRWLDPEEASFQVRCEDDDRVKNVRLEIDGQEVSAGTAPADGILTWTFPADAHHGLHTVRIVAEDAAGNRTEKTAWFTLTPRLPRIEWLPEKGVTVDGRPWFPLAIYGVRIQDMPRVAAAGFDVVHSYRWEGGGADRDALAWLDAAQEAGLRAFVGFNRGELMRGNEAFVAERVGALMQHPALFAWYLYDEPDLPKQYVAPERLERFYRLIRSLDPFHPVVVTVAHDSSVEAYRRAFDVHWTQVYGDVTFVDSRLGKHRRILGADVPILAILHAYDRVQTDRIRSGEEPDPGAFRPTPREMRTNALAALALGSSGLAWWWYGGGTDYYTVARVPEAWEGLGRVVAEIRDLSSVLLEPGPDERYVLEPEEGVRILVREKRTAEGLRIVAANTADRPVEVSWSPRTLSGETRLTVEGEDRTIPLPDGLLRDTFAPCSAHVYRANTDSRSASSEPF